MKPGNGSLRLRLTLAAAALIVLALALAGWGVGVIFERHVERRIVAELETDARQLLAGLNADAAGNIDLRRTPSAPPYDQPFSGRYWQLTRDGVAIETSRSLWNEHLTLPKDALHGGGYHKHFIKGPQGQHLIAVEREVLVRRGNATFSVRAIAALDRKELSDAASAFRYDMLMALAILGACLLTAFAAAISLGLLPLKRLRHDLKTLRDGIATRLGTEYPSEITPLVSDLNELLERQERLIDKARGRSADLAHGLKTPLTAISVIAQEMREQGDAISADELDKYAHDMQRTVERELSRARSAHGAIAGAALRLRPLVDLLVRTMKRLPRGDALDWVARIDDSVQVRVDREAMSEAIGNLLDNARKWAASQVTVTAVVTSEGLVIEISDDGAGVAEADRRRIFDRGRRLDESVPGSGFGISIAASVMEEIGGRLEIAESQRGGLSARLLVPKGLI